MQVGPWLPAAALAVVGRPVPVASRLLLRGGDPGRAAIVGSSSISQSTSLSRSSARLLTGVSPPPGSFQSLRAISRRLNSLAVRCTVRRTARLSSERTKSSPHHDKVGLVANLA